MAENLDNQKEWEERIDRKLKIYNNVIEIKEEPKQITLFPDMKPKKLSERYFKKQIILEAEMNRLRKEYYNCKGKIENSESKCKDKSLEYLEEKYDSYADIIRGLKNFCDKMSRKKGLKAIKMKNGEEADFLSVIEISQIEEKYKNRRNELSRSKKKKYLKFTGSKLDFLEEEITPAIYRLNNVKDNIIEYFAEIHLYTSKALSLYSIKKLLDTYEDLALLINEKYDKIISKKDFSKSAIYFSERECLDIEEICELIEKAYSIRLLIIRNFERILDDKQYIMDEFKLEAYDEEEAYEKLFNSIIGELDEFGYDFDEPQLQTELIISFNIKNRETMMKVCSIKKGSI